jgi:hypothetical protein
MEQLSIPLKPVEVDYGIIDLTVDYSDKDAAPEILWIL